MEWDTPNEEINCYFQTNLVTLKKKIIIIKLLRVALGKI